jgi:hypothetical protein
MKLGFQIVTAWVRYGLIMLTFFVMSILSITLFPLSYFFRYKTKWDILFFLLSNDPNDADKGGEWWLMKNNLSPGFFTSWRWTIRNPAWWFKTSVFVPDWNVENYLILKVISNTVSHPMDWVEADMRGKNHCYFKSKDNFYFRYSYTNNYISTLMGARHKKYVFKLRRSHKPKKE